MDTPWKLIRLTGTTYGKDAIDKEISKVKVAFRLLEEEESPPVASKLIIFQMVFDAKFNLTRKS